MSGEVRLVHTTGGIYMPTFGEVAHTHIALPAAEFEAWRRVVGAARARRAFERSEEGIESAATTAGMLRFCDLVDAENAALDAMPHNQQPGRAGGGK